jgi:hypothetical protein
MKEACCFLAIAAAVFSAIIGGFSYASHETSAAHYRAVWTGKGWKFDPPPPKGTIQSPFGFLHNLALQGESYTLTIPESRMGKKQVRVAIWSTGKTY